MLGLFLVKLQLNSSNVTVFLPQNDNFILVMLQLFFQNILDFFSWNQNQLPYSKSCVEPPISTSIFSTIYVPHGSQWKVLILCYRWVVVVLIVQSETKYYPCGTILKIQNTRQQIRYNKVLIKWSNRSIMAKEHYVMEMYSTFNI